MDAQPVSAIRRSTVELLAEGRDGMFDQALTPSSETAGDVVLTAPGALRWCACFAKRFGRLS
jgi:hypothetical protein